MFPKTNPMVFSVHITEGYKHWESIVLQAETEELFLSNLIKMVHNISISVYNCKFNLPISVFLFIVSEGNSGKASAVI